MTVKPIPVGYHTVTPYLVVARAAQLVDFLKPVNEFYWDRIGGVQDSFGNQWWIAAYIEGVSADELARRAADQVKR